MRNRWIALILIITLCVCMFSACKEKSSGGDFSIGYGMADVTPTESLPLAGYNGSSAAEFRWSTSTEWPFQAICVAITDPTGNTVMLFTLDLINATMADGMRDAVSNKTGVPKENIMFHCTHNHSGPSLGTDAPEVTNYISQLTMGVLTAAETAMADRAPITGMQTTYARPEGYNTERHYLLADGTYQSYGVGSVPKDQLIGHYGVADNLLQLVRFTRETAKDIVMVNWQGHPPGTDPNTIATSNFPGVLRNYLDKNLDCQSVFFLGGSGNLNNNSQIKGEIVHDSYQELGENLGATAVEAAANFTDRRLDTIGITEKVLQLDNLNYGATKVWVYAITIGDFALVTAPFEIFDDNAVAVRENSPYVMTMYLSCCNGSNGYLPTPPSFDWQITYEATITKFPKGTAEIVEGELIGMLKAMAEETQYAGPQKAEDYYQAEFVPKTNGVVYLNSTPGEMKYTAVKNDFYAFQLLDSSNTKFKNFLCKDEALVQQILGMSEVKLIFDVQGVVTGIAE